MDSTKLLLLIVRSLPFWASMDEVFAHIRWQDIREEPGELGPSRIFFLPVQELSAIVPYTLHPRSMYAP